MVCQVDHNIKSLLPCSLSFEEMHVQVFPISCRKLPGCINMDDQGPTNLLFPRID